MHTDDNNAIRYLMKEMDPSEELEFEQLMREDEDLLIEVESLRATNKKLSGLSLSHPPKKLTEQIQQQVQDRQSHSFFHKLPVSAYYLKRAVAAAVLLTVFYGGFYYYTSTPNNPSPVTDSVQGQTIEPWVDRNEVLRFTAGPQIQNTSNSQDDYSKSYDKLQLVSDPTSNLSGNQGILLTGSSN